MNNNFSKMPIIWLLISLTARFSPVHCLAGILFLRCYNFSALNQYCEELESIIAEVEKIDVLLLNVEIPGSKKSKTKKKENGKKKSLQRISKKLKPDEFQPGQKDNTNYEILDIYLKTLEIVVYRNTSFFRAYVDDDLEMPKQEAYFHKFSAIDYELTLIHGLEPNRANKKGILDLIGKGIANAVLGNTEQAKLILENAKINLLNLRLYNARIQYVYGTLVACFITIILTYFAYGEFKLAEVIAYGAIGATFSVIIKGNNIPVNLEAYWFGNMMSGALRVLIGIISSVIAYHVFHLDLIFTSFKNTNGGDFGIKLVSIIAGFSERFIPNIINNMANADTEKKVSDSKDTVNQHQSRKN